MSSVKVVKAKSKIKMMIQVGESIFPEFLNLGNIFI